MPEQNIGIQEESHSALNLGFHSLERVLNFVWKRGIEIVGNLNLPFVLSAHPAARFMKRDHARYGHAPASDNDLLAFGKRDAGAEKRVFAWWVFTVRVGGLSQVEGAAFCRPNSRWVASSAGLTDASETTKEMFVSEEPCAMAMILTPSLPSA